MLVVDEAHYIKNPEAARTKNVKRLAMQADRLLFMTGTALENNVDEMIALMKILNPDVAQEAKKIAFMSAAPLFRKAVSPVYFRRKREDVLKELSEVEITTLTPLDAMNTLYRLQSKLRNRYRITGE